MEEVVKEEENGIEVTIDEKDVKKEEIDDSEYQHMIPYEYRDYLEPHIEEEQATNSRKRKASGSSTEKPKVECQKCGRVIKMQGFQNVEIHAATHTNINRYICPVEECHYKSWLHQSVTRHMKLKHQIANLNVMDAMHVELSDQDKEEIRKVVIECFPGMIGKKTECQKCGTWKDLIYIQSAQRHAATHTNLYRFECIAESCGYSNWRRCLVERHVVDKHDGNMKYVKEKKLTQKEEQEVMDMVNMCFPGLVEISAQTSRESGDDIEQNLKDSKSSLKLIDETDVKKEKVDNIEYQHILPYEYQDNLEQYVEEKQPTNSRKIQEDKKMIVNCQKCGNGIHLTSFTEAKEHAATHTDLKSFKCEPMIDECFPGFIEQLLQKTDGKEVKIEEEDDCSYQQMGSSEYQDIEEEHPIAMPTLSREISIEEKDDNSFSRLIPFEYDGYTEQQPTDSRKRAAETESFCRICTKHVVVNNISQAEDHAITHTNLKRFKCSAKDCDMKSHYYACVYNHIKSWHSHEPAYVGTRVLDKKGEEVLKEMVGQCFPEFSDGQVRNIDEQWRYRCSLCNKLVFEDESNSIIKRRSHALSHTDTEYTCPEFNCNYKTNKFYVLVNHRKMNHRLSIVDSQHVRLKLGQEMKLSEMLKKCFPPTIKSRHGDKKVDGSYQYKNPCRSVLLESVKREERKKIECRKCEKWIVLDDDIQKAKQHAACHIELYRFECGAKECNYRSWGMDYVERHVIEKHNGISEYVKKRTLTEAEELERMVDTCFPGFAESQAQKPYMRSFEHQDCTTADKLVVPKVDVKIEEEDQYQHIIPYEYRDYKEQQPTNPRIQISKTRYSCQICYESIEVGNDVNSKVSRQNHALLHTDIVLYSCTNCDFKTEYLQSIHDHERLQHGINSLVPRNIIEATDEQKMEIERMYNRCFPY